MADHVYVSTNYKTRVNLLPHEMDPTKIDEFLLRRLKENYEGRTIKDGNILGFIRPGSLKLENRGRAFMTGSHFTGILCCNVVVNFDLYTPILNQTVEARVEKITPIGFAAISHPLRIIVAKTTTFDQPNQLFDHIAPDLQIPIEILHYELRHDYIYAVGRLKPFEEHYSKSYQILLPNAIQKTDDFVTLAPPATLDVSTKIIQYPQYGNPEPLNEAKDQISDPNDPDKEVYWEYYIKQYLNDYEIIGNNQYFNNKLIFSLEPSPISRSYYKLVEILSDQTVLQDFEDEPIDVLLLGETLGGFTQAMINSHNNPSDKLTAITLTTQGPKGVSTEYFKSQPNVDLWNKNLMDPVDIRDIMKTFEENDRKMQIVTADGAVDVGINQNYNYQERMNYKLFYGEILTAIACQAIDGHFVMKIYDIYTNVTNEFIHLLANLYQAVYITKPKTSRPANSERYLVCKYFRGLGTFPIEAHLNQLQTWNEADDVRKINVLTPFQERHFYVNSLITIQLDRQTTELIREKNQLFVTRQLETIKKGDEILEQLTGRNMTDSDKITTVTERMTKQIQNALLWCSNYLIKSACQPIPSTNITYYQTPQGPRNHKVGPLVPKASRRKNTNK